MRLSQLFSKTKKSSPQTEESINASLLIKGGFIQKTGAGIYTLLPLGFRVAKKIEYIIEEEMEKLGAQRILMPALTPKKNWKLTKRWDNFDTLFRLKGKEKKEYALNPTHEEVVVPLARSFIESYRDLPSYVYQIQTKFRDELRVKSGLLRTKEFLMKDLYSFHSSEKDLDNFYEKVKKSYAKIFKKLGLEKKTYLTLAKGGTFSRYSHEFQVVSDEGEDTIYICDKCHVAVNKELIRTQNKCWKCGKILKKEKKAIEIANTFKLKDKFSRDFNLTFLDKHGKRNFVLMGCYGIGISRLIGTLVETLHDDKGIIWPEIISPFKLHLVALGNDRNVKEVTKRLYNILQKSKIEVLYDDRNESSPGEKLADADLIGVPYRIVISKKTILRKKIEMKKRNSNKVKFITERELLNFLK